MKNTGGFKQIGSLIRKYDIEENKYINREWQGYGIKLAEDLGDEKHKSLYIKMARDYPRGLLESARSFVIDSSARNKGALFMWKVKQIKKEKDEKEKIKAEQKDMFDGLFEEK